MKTILSLLNFLLLYFMVSVSVQSQAAKSEEITIDRYGIYLKGVFFLTPVTEKSPTVVLLNGFPGANKDVLGLGNLLSEAGINVLTFSYSGTGESEGLASFENKQKDIQAALEFVRLPENIARFRIDTSLIYLGGWCHGGGMALAYSVNHPEITTVFSIVGNDFGEFMREYVRNPEMRLIVDEMMDKSVANGSTRFEKGALPKEMAEAGIENMNPIFDIRQNARELARKDILLICGWDDQRVTVDQYMFPLYKELKKENARSLKIIALQDGHNFSRTRRALADEIAAWILTASERIELK